MAETRGRVVLRLWRRPRVVVGGLDDAVDIEHALMFVADSYRGRGRHSEAVHYDGLRRRWSRAVLKAWPGA